MKPTPAKTRPTLDDVARLSSRLDVMAQLIVERDQLEARIAELDAVLNEEIPSPSSNPDPADDTTLCGAFEEKSLKQRLCAVCRSHPGGATLDDFAACLGVKRNTASSYLYSSRYGTHHYLDREYDSDRDVTVWVEA